MLYGQYDSGGDADLHTDTRLAAAGGPAGEAHAPRPCRPVLFAQSFAHGSSFTHARRFAGVFGAPPAPFTSAIRQLAGDNRSGCSSFSARSAYQLSRLLCGPTLLANLYYATKAYHPERWNGSPVRNPLDLARCHDPLTLAAIIALSYLFKRAKRLLRSEEWELIGEAVETQADIGMLLGQAAHCGYHGVLSGGMLQVAMAAFACRGESGFARYRCAIPPGELYDETLELREWGCTCYEIASCLLIAMGFGAGEAAAFCKGFSGCPEEELNADGAAYRRMRNGLQAVSRGDMAAGDAELAQFVRRSASLRADSSARRWLSRTSADASPDKLDELTGVSWERTSRVLELLRSGRPRPARPLRARAVDTLCAA